MRRDDVRVSHDPSPQAAPAGAGEDIMGTQVSPYIFFGLLFLLSAPFWLLGTLARLEILPALPISAAMVIAPVLAASILVWRAGGHTAFKSFF